MLRREGFRCEVEGGEKGASYSNLRRWRFKVEAVQRFAMRGRPINCRVEECSNRRTTHWLKNSSSRIGVSERFGSSELVRLCPYWEVTKVVSVHGEEALNGFLTHNSVFGNIISKASLDPAPTRRRPEFTSRDDQITSLQP
jgi:hypothetical protein